MMMMQLLVVELMEAEEHRNWALDFMRVCMPRGSGIRERGFESEISGMT